jgi:5-methylcytosine-specific restriction endonuclease McrA
MTIILKRCPKCKIEKPIDTGFHKNKTQPSGVAPYCKRCRSSKKELFDAKEKGLRFCKTCKRELPIDNFHIRKGYPSSYCRECTCSDEHNQRVILRKQNLKQCSNCKTIKPFSEFHKARTRSDGHDPNCKECEKVRGKQKYLKGYSKIRERHSKSYYKQREYYREKHKEWYYNNPGYSAERSQRRRALEYQAQGSYTIEQFQELCKHYGNKCLCCSKKEKLTVDHVIPLSKGGSNDIDNIQPLCMTCNRKKGTKTTDYRPMAQPCE